MNEFDLIRKYFQHSLLKKDVEIGIGDDCAVLSLSHDEQLVVSIDTMVQGVHFHANAKAEDIGSRAVSAALSDLAAMGATPRWVTLALTVPSVDRDWLASFSEGLFSIINSYNCALVGGDTTQGPLTISIQVHGTLPNGKRLSRDGAKPGDLVCVTGCLGDGAAALKYIEQGGSISQASVDYLHNRFYRPTPQIELGEKLLQCAHSAIDVSDGFLADLAHICNASNVGAEINIDQLPISQACLELDKTQSEYWALNGGDDYQLCFTLPREKKGWVGNDNDHREHTITVVGHITTDLGIRCQKNGKTISLEQINQNGYQHFG